MHKICEHYTPQHFALRSHNKYTDCSKASTLRHSHGSGFHHLFVFGIRVMPWSSFRAMPSTRGWPNFFETWEVRGPSCQSKVFALQNPNENTSKRVGTLFSVQRNGGRLGGFMDLNVPRAVPRTSMNSKALADQNS